MDYLIEFNFLAVWGWVLRSSNALSPSAGATPGNTVLFAHVLSNRSPRLALFSRQLHYSLTINF